LNIILSSRYEINEIKDAIGTGFYKPRWVNERTLKDLLGNANTRIKNGVASWWVSNSFTLNGYSYIGCIEEDGTWSVVAINNTDWSEAYRVRLGRFVDGVNDPADEHNPVGITSMGDKVHLFYTRHGLDNVIRWRVADTTGLDGFGEERIIESSGLTTYAQVIRITTKIYLMYRSGDKWILRRSVSLDDNTWTAETAIARGVGSEEAKSWVPYILMRTHGTSADRIRFAVYGQAVLSEARNIYAFYLNTSDDTFSYAGPTVIGSFVPGTDNDFTPATFGTAAGAIAFNADATPGTYTRLLDMAYNGTWTIFFCSWTILADMQYKVATYTGGNWVVKTISENGTDALLTGTPIENQQSMQKIFIDIRTACTSNGNVVIRVNNVDYTIALTTADDTIAKVARRIADNLVISGWTVSVTSTGGVDRSRVSITRTSTNSITAVPTYTAIGSGNAEASIINNGRNYYCAGGTFAWGTATSTFVIYLARETTGTWTVEKWTSTNTGATWTLTDTFYTGTTESWRPTVVIGSAATPLLMFWGFGSGMINYFTYTDVNFGLHAG
jgi:hypothetical protein